MKVRPRNPSPSEKVSCAAACAANIIPATPSIVFHIVCMTTSEFTSRAKARPGFRRSDISAQRPPWMSAICDKMCRTGADTTFERLFGGYRKLRQIKRRAIRAGREVVSRGSTRSSQAKASIETCKKFLLEEKEFTRCATSSARNGATRREIRGIGDRCSDFSIGSGRSSTKTTSRDIALTSALFTGCKN
jgi:hypothetical protein